MMVSLFPLPIVPTNVAAEEIRALVPPHTGERRYTKGSAPQCPLTVKPRDVETEGGWPESPLSVLVPVPPARR